MPHRKKTYISELKEGNNIESIFLVKLKSLQQAKNGKNYLNIILTDKSGEVECRVWDNALDINERFNKDDFVYIKGRTKKYMEKIQITINEIQRINEDLVNLADFQPSSERNIKKMKDELNVIISEIINPYLKKLLQKIFHNEDIAKRFITAPAAKGIHHAYIGGLMEHTLNTAKVANSLRAFYPMADFDIIVTALLLHDIGKIKELNFQKSFDYTDEGRLLGHIVLSYHIVDKAIQTIDDFPSDLRMELLHVILSHHGTLEFGSPKRPKTLEAIITSYIDDMDSKVYGVFQFAKNDSSLKNSNWTAYHKMYDRFFYFPKEKRNFEAETQKNSKTKQASTTKEMSSLGDYLSDEVKEKLKQNIGDEETDEDTGENKDSKEQEVFDF